MCQECPNCHEKTFIYDVEKNANFCINELCKWTDRVTEATDVPRWFLKYCLEHAKSKQHKAVIKKIIWVTKKAKQTTTDNKLIHA